MSKLKQSLILMIFFSFIFILTGCGPHKPNGDSAPPIKTLPTKLTTLLENESGIKFGHILAHQMDGKSVIFSRLEEDERGNKLYETIKLDPATPITVSELNGQITYSKTNISTGDAIKINNMLFSHCEYVNIGSNANLICKTEKNTEFQYKETENDIIPDLVVRGIEEKIDGELQWLALIGNHKGQIKAKLMRKAGHVIFDSTTVFDTEIKLDLSEQLNVKTIFGVKNPCKCIVQVGDTVYVTYKQICP